MAGLRQRAVAGCGWEIAGGDVAPAHDRTTNPEVVKPHNGAEQALSGLVRTIEHEVVPRLVLARRAASEQASSPPADVETPTADDVAELAGRALGRDEAAAASFVDALRWRGMSVETLYLDLLTPTARHLGTLWDQDRCHFAEITLALMRLHHVLRELAPAFRGHAEGLHDGRRALLVPVPGEQHTFGLSMVVEFFRRVGWDVHCRPLKSNAELAALVRREWFAIVGISVGGERWLDQLVASIRAIRSASRNRSIGVMVGGPIFLERPELVTRVGADATAVDGRQAVVQAQDLLTLLARGPR